MATILRRWVENVNVMNSFDIAMSGVCNLRYLTGANLDARLQCSGAHPFWRRTVRSFQTRPETASLTR